MNPVLGLGGVVTLETMYVTPGTGSGRWGHPGDCGRVTPVTVSGRVTQGTADM